MVKPEDAGRPLDPTHPGSEAAKAQREQDRLARKEQHDVDHPPGEDDSPDEVEVVDETPPA